MKGKAEALCIKPGPTQSGFNNGTIKIVSKPVGGEVLPVDKMALVSLELLIILIIVIPAALFLFYKKPGILLRLLSFFKY